ncbi:unnamed protein product [Rotaria socialis]|uniref:Uncharacterized protein n=1 Tax=Rotaria socialis TaxID=392032 RepID=A0A817SPL5_9BILA|nr:unnamed protein product [Rotaria socialis]CAF3404468.1 unnamed protein product [Rotaria socialis]CAF3405228.1 unnamed protein product [Rotaria socialis]CAF3417534.1 unnamed protein product [Rotaria socialis]CAF3742544.1 unnamed protein product [Rotaria socialis]
MSKTKVQEEARKTNSFNLQEFERVLFHSSIYQYDLPIDRSEKELKSFNVWLRRCFIILFALFILITIHL